MKTQAALESSGSEGNSLSVVLRDEIKALLSPLIAAAQVPSGIQVLLQSVGRAGTLSGRSDLRSEIARLAALAEDIAGLDTDALGSWDGLAELLGLARDVLTALKRLEEVLSDPSLAEQGQDLGLDLIQNLLALHLRARHQTAFRVASLLTLITPSEAAAPLPMEVSGSEIVRYARHADRFHPDRIEDLLKRPLAALSEHYFPNGLATAKDAHESARRLFPLLTLLARALELSSYSENVRAIPEPPSPPPAPRDDLDHFSGSEDDDEDAPPVILPPPAPVDLEAYLGTVLPRFAFVLPGLPQTDGSPAPARFAISTLVSSASHPGGARGLVITPLGQLNWSEVRDGWRFSLESSGQVPAVVLGPGGISRAPGSLTAGTARLVIERLPEAGAPAFIMGSAKGTHLEIGALRLTADLRVAADDSSLAVAADALSGGFVLAAGDGDSFLKAILPDDGLRCEFDLGVEVSSKHGLKLRGSAGLEATLPVGLSLGPVSIPLIHLNVGASGGGVTAEASASAAVSLGPFTAAIDRIGMKAALTFPETGGNVGIGDLSVGFKPPSGIGLSIDQAAVSGGGFLYLDFDKGQYAGVVQLSVRNEINVKGVGLISTRLPDGAKGFSLLVIITAEDFQPIPLPLGFKITGFGGLLAMNRTFNEDALRTGLKSHTLDSVMFPKDPIRNAPQILSNLNKVFPQATGSHLFGPMVQIAWGSASLITANLAVVLEFGARLRLLILAQIASILPKRENDLVRLHMDAVGVVDFDQATASLDATLYDSRLVKKYALTGDMAMRLNWGKSPNFALAIGGLHPAFNPPPNFPKLERVALNLSSGNNVRIRCESYFALTSNTVQFGARAELFVSAAGFSIHGETGYDVLIQLDPFQFLADFFAQVQLKRGSTNLFKVRVEGALAGPRPLHIKAKATFEILWMDVTIRIDKTLVEGEKPPAPQPVDVLPLLRQELGNAGNWVGQLPAGQLQMVTLRPRPGAATDVLLHPLGTLTVKQTVVPLNKDISRFGPAAPAGTRRFAITGVTLGGKPQTAETVKDFFAPAQFIEMSDDEKLSTPSFEAMAAGVRIGSQEFTFTPIADDWLEVEAIEFETWILNKQEKETRRDPKDTTTPYRMTPVLLGKQARFGAAGASSLRRTGNAKYRVTAAGRHGIEKEGWSIVAKDNMTAQSAPGSYSEAAQSLRNLKQTDPARARGLKIVRLSELSGN